MRAMHFEQYSYILQEILCLHHVCTELCKMLLYAYAYKILLLQSLHIPRTNYIYANPFSSVLTYKLPIIK